ncbi:hypothetical protein [Paracoccus zhejiangensis]|uniref:Uncharacterized protein n=1 Tax=Paracoccus zhejiangensis TaxID=1077935 RepID=A0A2H5F0R0_9RHOB|nr:hypothetical protein [Paracoccus zhejiangensis]AUH65134.1 hypothetical protein CX676_13915 [Paracoccus zhejiangensis]
MTLEAKQKNHLEEVIGGVERELAGVMKEISIEEQKLNALVSRRDSLRAALRSLIDALPSTERKRQLIEAADYEGRDPIAVSETARKLIEFIRSDIERVWQVGDLQQRLEKHGERISDRYASNTLRKLRDRGLISRVGRGKYRANNTILAIEGLDEDDLE